MRVNAEAHTSLKCYFKFKKAHIIKGLSLNCTVNDIEEIYIYVYFKVHTTYAKVIKNN
ncbi:hypothetical protein RIVM261_081950 [Rivularia sp. IAM M-261]|nr:hypothetical protein CAL7716_098390 [Calothrix sp. PCC 7716]GJD23239.1 hypothetical protein RIVM261_081950 [Rivularia sp. IAM M-261]